MWEIAIRRGLVKRASSIGQIGFLEGLHLHFVLNLRLNDVTVRRLTEALGIRVILEKLLGLIQHLLRGSVLALRDD